MDGTYILHNNNNNNTTEVFSGWRVLLTVLTVLRGLLRQDVERVELVQQQGLAALQRAECNAALDGGQEEEPVGEGGYYGVQSLGIKE